MIGWEIDQYRLVICLTNVIGWKLNQLGLVNLTNIILVLYFTYIAIKIHWRNLFGRHLKPLNPFTRRTLVMRTKKNPLEELVWSSSQTLNRFTTQEDIGDANQQFEITFVLTSSSSRFLWAASDTMLCFQDI